MQNLSLKSPLDDAIEIFFKRLYLFLPFILLFFFSNYAPYYVQEKGNFNELLQMQIIIVSLITYVYATITTVKISLKASVKAPVSLKDYFDALPRFFSLFIASLAYVVVIVIGLILLIVPGIYFSIKYMFYSYFIVDQKMGPFAALKASADLTRGKILKFFFIFIGMGIFIGMLVYLINYFQLVDTKDKMILLQNILTATGIPFLTLWFACHYRNHMVEQKAFSGNNYD